MKSFWHVVFLLIVGCASAQSVNQYKSDKLLIRGGVSGDSEWSDALVFSRSSWFQKATMLYEILLADVPAGSPFRNWFTSEEQQRLQSCQQLVVGLNYVYTFAKIPVRNMQDQMRSAGFKELVSVSFERQVYNHPDASRLRPRLYRVHIFCHEEAPIHSINLEVPGFKVQEVSW